MTKANVFYRWYPNNYAGGTQMLSCLGHGAYIQLLNYYMGKQKPLPDDDEKLAHLAKLSLEEWVKIRPEVEDLFKIRRGKWTHEKVEKEIKANKQRSKTASNSAKKRWKNEKSGDPEDVETKGESMQTHSERNARHKTVDSRQDKKKPTVSKKPGRKTGTRLEADWWPDDKLKDWARAKVADSGKSLNLRNVTEAFVNYWISRPGKAAEKLDWNATYRNWVIRELRDAPMAQAGNQRSGGRGDV